MENENIFKSLEEEVMKSDMPESQKEIMLKNIMRMKNKKLNVMITGATGCGKSSTINALFEIEVAKVGVGVDPETMSVEKYELENMTLWDTPGLGDGKEADNRHAKYIIEKLSEVDGNGDALIDLILVILDGGSRDLGTSYELINNVIIPNLGREMQDRLLIAINQADMAMKGRNWDYEKNAPNDQLKAFLDEKVESVKKRVLEATGVSVDPIYYCAGYKEEGMPQCRPYNLSKLLYYIVKATPAEKRAIYVEHINRDAEMWRDDDELRDYGEETRKNIVESVIDAASKGADIGGDIGEALAGSFGRTVGSVIGGAVGGIVGAGKAIAERVIGTGRGRRRGGALGGGGSFFGGLF